MNKNDATPNSTDHLKEAVSILKACQPLAAHLVMQGITVKLSDQERNSLLKFKQIIEAGYSDSQWSYLRVASGIQVSGIAALTSCLNRNF